MNPVPKSQRSCATAVHHPGEAPVLRSPKTWEPRCEIEEATEDRLEVDVLEEATRLGGLLLKQSLAWGRHFLNRIASPGILPPGASINRQN